MQKMSKQKEALAPDPIELGRVPRGEADSTQGRIDLFGA